MIKNDKEEEKLHLINKLIIATFLALFGSLLSTILITSAHAADHVAITQPKVTVITTSTVDGQEAQELVAVTMSLCAHQLRRQK